ncbi:MAG: DUF1816 domain-containing protein [Cyanobacteriota bacterium]|nr:DUF1816 domain-containing protein [Cyanobacteriota bacterium]
MDPLLWPARRVINALGLAWWARIETRSPDATYWYGPFVRRDQLDDSLPAFLEDVRSEGPAEIRHDILQTRRGEPLTEASDLTIDAGDGAG